MSLSKPTNGSNADYAGRIGALFDAVNTVVTSFVPTISSGSGTITTASATFRYHVVGTRLWWYVRITITTNGTGASNVRFTVPFSPAANVATGAGLESALSGKAVQCVWSASGFFTVVDYTGAYPGANGAVLELSGHYDV